MGWSPHPKGPASEPRSVPKSSSERTYTFARRSPADPRDEEERVTTVRVMQEGWGVFENLPATAARYSAQTGVEVEVTLTVIPEMWELMERSFSGEDPPFDLVGVDDLLLIQAARAGHVEPLDDLIAADGYPLDDFTSQALAAVSDGGHIWGLPYCDVSNVLIYRADLFDRYGIAVPQTLEIGR